jgi:16S rRNA (guanine966-N2)-methyltransferase
MMRIVGGEFRGRPLATPKSSAIRPTSDRTRESLFNILAHGYGDVIRDGRVLDLFAGTGAFGIEALSRGAKAALFVENSAEGRALIQANIEAFGLQGKARIMRRDATSLGPAGRVEPFNLVFADPPYAKGLGEKALGEAIRGGWIARDGLVLLEERAEIEIVPPSSLFPLELRVFGETAIRFYRFAGVVNE